MNAAEIAAYKIHHTFYNVIDDIHVNNSVARRAPLFESEEAGGREIERLYREKLFVQTDYSKLPRHLQFLYKLLREEMVPDQEVVVNDEVAEVMRKKIKFQGREYMPKEIVELFIKPRADRNNPSRAKIFCFAKYIGAGVYKIANEGFRRVGTAKIRGTKRRKRVAGR